VPVLILYEIWFIIGNLYSITIGGLDIVDPASALQTILLSKEVTTTVLFGLIVPIVLALVFGKVFCSWMCPYNTLTEWLTAVSAKLFKKRARKAKLQLVDRNPNPILYWSILAAILILSWMLEFPLVLFLSAPGIISSEISHVILGMGMGLELLIVLVIISFEALIFKRYWCKYVCPVGAVLSLFRVRKTLRVAYDKAVCNCAGESEPCSYICPLQLSPKQPYLYPYCFNCGLCIKICEKSGSGALSFKFDEKKITAEISNSKKNCCE
jgi:ferredoxin-type protein NapH